MKEKSKEEKKKQPVLLKIVLQKDAMLLIYGAD